MATVKEIIELVNGLPDEDFVEVLNLYAESEQRAWRIYKNTKEEFNKVFEGVSPRDVAEAVLNAGKEYNRTDSWILVGADMGLVSGNNPRVLLPHTSSVLEFMAKYYLMGMLSKELVQALDRLVNKGDKHGDSSGKR